MFITGSVLVQANQFFGDSLACEGVSRFMNIFSVLCVLLIVLYITGWGHSGWGSNSKLLHDVFCFSSPRQLPGDWILHFKVSYKCYQSQGFCTSDAHAGTSLYNSYYLWVSFFLIIQVIPNFVLFPFQSLILTRILQCLFEQKKTITKIQIILRQYKFMCPRQSCSTSPGASGWAWRAAWWSSWSLAALAAWWRVRGRSRGIV